MDKLMPPLNALHAFEAAARHLSLTKAAQELHVTAGGAEPPDSGARRVTRRQTLRATRAIDRTNARRQVAFPWPADGLRPHP